jgi:hypothetical protein
MAWIYVSTKVDTHQKQVMPFQQIAGICRRRGGSGCGGVSRMDAATELTWTYLQRPPQPDLPRLPTGSQLLLLLRPLLLLLPLRVQGAALPIPPIEHSAQCFERRTHAQHGTLCATGLPITHREEPP